MRTDLWYKSVGTHAIPQVLWPHPFAELYADFHGVAHLDLRHGFLLAHGHRRAKGNLPCFDFSGPEIREF